MEDLAHFDGMTDVQLERIVGNPANPQIDLRAREILAARRTERQAAANALGAARHAELVELAKQPAMLSREQRFTLWTATIAGVIGAILAVPPFVDWCRAHFGDNSTSNEHRFAPPPAANQSRR